MLAQAIATMVSEQEEHDKRSASASFVKKHENIAALNSGYELAIEQKRQEQLRQNEKAKSDSIRATQFNDMKAKRDSQIQQVFIQKQQ